MKPQYIGYLAEECGEVLQALGKSLRWGLAGENPELPLDERESNAEWLLRELVDLERAIDFARSAIIGRRFSGAVAEPPKLDRRGE